MAQTVRAMHFADTHFGVELYGRLDPSTGLNTRLQDFRRSLNEAVDSALDAGVDVALFAGDAYKNRDPRQTDQREFASCIRRLTEQGIPVVLLAGNHDMPAIRGRAHAVEIYRTLGVTNVHVVSHSELLTLDTRSGPLRIAPVPYLLKGISMARDQFQGKTLEEGRLLLEAHYVETIGALADEVRALDDQTPTVLLGHFWARGARLSAWQQGYFSLTEPQVPLDALTDPAFDYVALGHIHRQQDLNPAGQPHVVYCGSSDRIDFGEKDEPKGFVIADIRKGGAEYRFVEVSGGRRMLDIVVDADCDDPTAAIIAEVKRHPLRDSLVRLTYDISRARQGLVRTVEIREALAPAFLTVSLSARVQRDTTARHELLDESKSPREALSMFIDTREQLLPLKDRLLAAAEPLFVEIEAEIA